MFGLLERYKDKQRQKQEEREDLERSKARWPRLQQEKQRLLVFFNEDGTIKLTF